MASTREGSEKSSKKDKKHNNNKKEEKDRVHKKERKDNIRRHSSKVNADPATAAHTPSVVHSAPPAAPAQPALNKSEQAAMNTSLDGNESSIVPMSHGTAKVTAVSEGTSGTSTESAKKQKKKKDKKEKESKKEKERKKEKKSKKVDGKEETLGKTAQTTAEKSIKTSEKEMEQATTQQKQNITPEKENKQPASRTSDEPKHSKQKSLNKRKETHSDSEPSTKRPKPSSTSQANVQRSSSGTSRPIGGDDDSHANKKVPIKSIKPIGGEASRWYPHHINIYPDNTDPRKKFRSRVVGLPSVPDFSISDSDSDSDSDSEGAGPLNDLHKRCYQYRKPQVEQFEKIGLHIKSGKWDVVENGILEKRLKKIARRKKMSFEEVQSTFFAQTFTQNQEFWWSLARPFSQRTMHNIFHHVKRMYDENNYQGQWDAESDAKLMALVEEHGMAWTKIGHIMGRTSNAIVGRHRLIVNKKKGVQNNGVWTDDEVDLLIQTVKKYKSEMKITDDKDISWIYVSSVFKDKRNPLQLRYKWHVISPYVNEDQVIKPTFGSENWQQFKRILVNKLLAGNWEHESQIPWASFRDDQFTLDSEASRKLYYRMRNRISGFDKLALKDIVAKIDEQLKAFGTDDADDDDT